jgi:hypothetical protein
MRLQIHHLTDYFLVMRKIGKGGQMAGFRSGWGVPAAALIVVLGTACKDRERLTFDPADEGVGPVIVIDQPVSSDTTVPSGSDFFVNGTVADPDGVDTVYFSVSGGSQNYPPYVPNPVETSVRFGVPIETAGRAGQSLEIQIYGVDVRGNRGGTSSRQIQIQ